jgi:hypothetical protein
MDVVFAAEKIGKKKKVAVFPAVAGWPTCRSNIAHVSHLSAGLAHALSKGSACGAEVPT